MGISIITSVQVAAIGVFIYSSLSVNLQSCLCVIILICTVFLRRREVEPEETNPFKRKSKKILSEIAPDLLTSAKSAVFDYVTYPAENGVDSLRRFNLIKNKTQCSFAKTARLWGSPQWRPDISLERNIERSLPTFLTFSCLCREEPLDGFVYELPGDIFGQDLEEFSKAVCSTLKIISDNDPKGRKCMDQKYIDKLGWVFEFNSITFFITTFAPFYPETHSRYSFGTENSYILFQPEISFARHDLGPDTPRSRTEWDDPKTPRDRIRCAFRNAGRPYEIPETVASPVAKEVVRPLRQCNYDDDDIGGDEVQWWKYREHFNTTVKMVSFDE